MTITTELTTTVTAISVLLYIFVAATIILYNLSKKTFKPFVIFLSKIFDYVIVVIVIFIISSLVYWSLTHI